MAYDNIAQALALSKTPGKDVGLQMKPFPQLRGKLASIDPEGVAMFNSEVAIFFAELKQEIVKAITEARDKS